MIEVLKKGLFSSIQDMGRTEGIAFGVPISGAMDRSALIRVNAILGNDPDCAAIECTLIGPELRFHKSTAIAVSGADMTPKLNGSPISMLREHSIKTGDILKLGPARIGCRAYIGVKGGLLSDEVLGSRSQYEGVTPESFLDSGAFIEIGSVDRGLANSKARLKTDHAKFTVQVIDVQEGPEFKYLERGQVNQLFDQTFHISKLNSRMACQLEELIPNQIQSIITAPVLPGTVQLTPSGQLIVLMRDAQTTGGYPRVLQLNHHGIDILAQRQSGQRISFKILK